jgi:glucosamine-6-phosphate deaminase
MPGKYPGWWDWTSFAAENPEMMTDVRALTLGDLAALSRPGFEVRMYDTAQDFFVAEALEYVHAWMRSTPDKPVAVCGPVGPTEQLPIVARIINELGLDVRAGWFAGMDEFIEDGVAIPETHPLSFRATDMNLCFRQIRAELRMPEEQLFFPTEDIRAYNHIWEDLGITIAVTQGGQGWTKHIAFDDPAKMNGDFSHVPPSADRFAQLPTRIVELHPLTLAQDAHHSNGGEISQIPTHAVTVGMHEILTRSELVSIHHPGHHDNPFGVRLTTYMISKGIQDGRVPMSLLARHPNVRFSFLRPMIGNAGVDMK